MSCNTSLWKTSVVCLAGALIVAHDPGAARAEPGWCKGASFAGEVDPRDLAAKEPQRVVAALAHASCAPDPRAAANRAEVDRSRAAWGQRLGMTEADWGDVIAWIDAGEGRDVKLELSTRELARFTPIDQYIAIAEGFPRPGGDAPFVDPIYVADALEPALGEVGRYAYLGACLKATTSVTSSAPPAATWALCQGDVERFDLARFHDELRADPAHRGDVKMMLRFAAFDLKQRLADHARAVEKARRIDPAYAAMFELAAAARRDWAAGLGKRADLLALAQRMESAHWAGSRKLYEGCEATTAAALEAAIAKVPASTWKAMKDQRFDPYGGFAQTAGPVLVAIPEINLVAGAYVLCRPRTATADFLANFLEDTVAHRGPRTAAFARMLAEKLTLDAIDEEIYWPATRRPYRRSGGTVGSAGGVVAKTTAEGDAVRVTLERFLVKRTECVQSHATRKITRILPDGKLEYERVCDRMGEVTYDQTWADFQIAKAYAPLLKKGVKFSAIHPPGGGPAEVIVIWPDKKTEVPTWLLGARVK
ncbi:MAG: hypothetical protein HS111_17420 [Kofleriaceae bacterium]|nr:hypothetical protein [Kofleriaceae bacterium]MCL4223054.1 hypothetical protein [Myxococcales bacterium]